jgi:L-asparaginase II
MGVEYMEKTVEQPISVSRGEHLESTHTFHAAVVNHKGERIYYYGNPERLTFARSSMKPFQAIPLVETGATKAFNYGLKEFPAVENMRKERIGSIEVDFTLKS